MKAKRNALAAPFGQAGVSLARQLLLWLLLLIVIRRLLLLLVEMFWFLV